jgi:hypothetical protein
MLQSDSRTDEECGKKTLSLLWHIEGCFQRHGKDGSESLVFFREWQVEILFYFCLCIENGISISNMTRKWPEKDIKLKLT